MKLSYLAPTTFGFSLAMVVNVYFFQTDHCIKRQNDNIKASDVNNGAEYRVASNSPTFTQAATKKSDRINKSAYNSSRAKTECTSIDQLASYASSSDNFLKVSHDSDGRLLIENKYIVNLTPTQIESLAKQGYAYAMAALSTRLLESHRTNDIHEGRKWAYKAAVHGILFPLTYLAASYLEEYQTLKAKNKSTHNVAIKYESTLRLVEHLAPGSTTGLMGSIPLSSKQKMRTEKQALKLIKNYNDQRQQSGLNKLSVAVPNTMNAAEFLVCNQTMTPNKVI
ncbi:hypothetical protein [Agarilytica rhodophyticola]|uniref:hypothetical protein n=1 Tax=Agarilytica rhodophyticola TaxID=1737490 RepID=UPI000B34246D|nr:hypothetical protein [Agarilytica rhodophyticola]